MSEHGAEGDALWHPVTECGCSPATGMHAVTCAYWPLYVIPPQVNRCDWGQCGREPEPEGSAFCTLHAEEWERVQQEKADDWWAD